jgi:hypothetical protein
MERKSRYRKLVAVTLLALLSVLVPQFGEGQPISMAEDLLQASLNPLENLMPGDYPAAIGTGGQVPAKSIKATGDNRWASGFSLPGLDGMVYALTVDAGGNLYAGGKFTTAGGAAASRIARWDGSTWVPLGSGTYGYVSALTVDANGNLCAGGFFQKAGGKLSGHFAVWKGRPALVARFASHPGLHLYRNSRWEKIYESSPDFLAIRGSKLVANFPGRGIFEFDGAAWRQLKERSAVEMMVALGNQLFIDLGPKGLHRYNGVWTRVHPSNPTKLAPFGNKLASVFPRTATSRTSLGAPGDFTQTAGRPAFTCMKMTGRQSLRGTLPSWPSIPETWWAAFAARACIDTKREDGAACLLMGVWTICRGSFLSDSGSAGPHPGLIVSWRGNPLPAIGIDPD